MKKGKQHIPSYFGLAMEHRVKNDILGLTFNSFLGRARLQLLICILRDLIDSKANVVILFSEYHHY